MVSTIAHQGQYTQRAAHCLVTLAIKKLDHLQLLLAQVLDYGLGMAPHVYPKTVAHPQIHLMVIISAHLVQRTQTLVLCHVTLVLIPVDQPS